MMASKVHSVRQCDAVTLLTSHDPNADNTAATKTITCTASQFAVVWEVTYSYDETPPVGTAVTITPLLNNLGYKDFAGAGGTVRIKGPFYGDVGDDIIITAAAAAAIKCTINASYTIHNVGT